MRILLTGGAGYIGAIAAQQLRELGHDILVYDHFFSHSPAKLGEIPYVKAGLLDPRALDSALSSFHPDVVMHFAAYIQMGESVKNPRKYYDNNVIGTLALIEAMIKHGCHKLIFASTAGVYGNPKQIPIPEDHPKEPENPYGETKLTVERLLKWYDQAYDFRSISIRFFNAAGATEVLGEDHHDESHIIPNIINAQLAGKEFTLFGNDYPTPDGTCVRDYIHVLDLVEAFRLAAEKLMSGGATTTYNAGTGHGYSNLEIIKMVEKVSGKPVKIKYEPRRPGDANELVADVTRIQSELSWSPTHSDLESIIRSAYDYHSKKWYIEIMSTTFNNAQIQQIKQAMKEVLVDELGENYQGRLDRIENKVDMSCKIAKDTQDEHTVTKAKVDRHDDEIKQLQSFTGFATAWSIASLLFRVTIALYICEYTLLVYG